MHNVMLIYVLLFDTGREKFEELVAKERDLNNFMDSFPSRRAAKLEELRHKQDAIVALLDKMNKLSSIATGALPSQKKFKEMQVSAEGRHVSYSFRVSGATSLYDAHVHHQL